MLKIRIAAFASLLCVAGCRVVEPPPPPDAPRIESFTADKTRVGPGETVTLSYATNNGTKVEIIDDSGRQLELQGELEAGTATVAPPRSSFYVLRLTGAGGVDTAFVQVAVNEPLQTVFLIAVPAVIRSGEQAQLLWGAAGATGVTLTTGAGMPQALTGTTGTVAVTPSATQNYTLTAQGAPGTPPLTALAEVQVRPVLETASVEAVDGYQVGKTVNFAWKTIGATRVVVSERTLGQLTSVTDAALVQDGTFDFVLPATLPNGLNVADGLPLRFRVEASVGAELDAQQFERVVGERPVIEFFEAPLNASVSRSWTVSWKTINATRVSIAVAGQEVFRTLPADLARAAEGSVSLPSPLSSTAFTLTASNARGSVSRTFTVTPVPLPTIGTYTLTGTFAAIGDPVTAAWTATGAVSAHLRLENGATLATVTTAAQVASGSVVLTPSGASHVTLEVFNAAGDSATETRTVAFTGAPVAAITPSPVFRGATATLSWVLAPASVVEVVGLPTPPPALVTASTNFVDLTTVATARPLFFADTTNGAARVPALPGFRFSLLGVPKNDLWVSANGFIAFAKPEALSANVDLAASGNTTPSMLAPFWDDLSLPATASVLYAVRTMPNGERALIVQWDKVQLASDPTSELTFQAQLFETGQVTFVYGTLTAAAVLDSVTVGVKDTVFPAAQVYVANSATTPPTTGHEVSFFTAGNPDGSVSFPAGAARTYTFFARTATARVPVSATLRSFGAGEVEVSEVMARPEASVSALGKWIELRNRMAATVDFGGLRVDTLGSTPDGGYDIPLGTQVDAGAFLVIGQSTTPADTGGAPVDLVGTDLPLMGDDRVRVRIASNIIASYTFASPDAGVSAQPADTLVATGQTFTCLRAQTFGTTGSVGTPGALNEPCAPYVISSIPGRFTVGPSDSTILPAITDDDDYGNVDLPQPFTYFGTSMSRLGVSTNGFLTLQSAALATSGSGNDSAPATTSPNGVLAPFWDDLARGTGRHAMWREADRTIISFETFAVYASTRLTPAEMSLNFQVHLVDSGVIEFHYGTMTTTLPTRVNEVAGSGATVWLERQDGAIAVPFSVNQPRIFPNSGIRFTPR